MASNTVVQSVPILFLYYQNRRKRALCAELLRSRKVLNAITEIAYNLLKNFPISSKDKKTFLTTYADELELLTKKRQYIKKYQLLTSDPKGHKLLVRILSLTLPYLLTGSLTITSNNGNQIY